MWNTQHIKLLYIIIHHTYLFTFQICTYHTCTYIIVYFVFAFLIIAYFVYLYIILFIICVLSCCCLSVALWRFCHYNKFLVCVNIPGNNSHMLLRTSWRTSCGKFLLLLSISAKLVTILSSFLLLVKCVHIVDMFTCCSLSTLCVFKTHHWRIIWPSKLSRPKLNFFVAEILFHY